MTAFEDFVNLELPKRRVLLNFANSGYDGDPNDGGAPAIISSAPLGTWFRELTAEKWWTKTETVWEEGVGGDLSTASNALIYREGSSEAGPVVFGTWAGVMARLDALRSGGDGSYEVLVDDSITSPTTIPANPDTAPVAPTAAFTFASPIMTLTDGGAAFDTSLIGRWVTIAGATTPANDGTFIITGVPSPTQLEYENATGVAEAVGGATYALTVPHNMKDTKLGASGTPSIEVADRATFEGLRKFDGGAFLTCLSVAGSPSMVSDFYDSDNDQVSVENGFGLNGLGGGAPPLFNTRVGNPGMFFLVQVRNRGNIAQNPGGGSPIFHVGLSGQFGVVYIFGGSNVWRNGLSSVAGGVVFVRGTYGEVFGDQPGVLGTLIAGILSAGPKQNVEPNGLLPASTTPINAFSHAFEVLRLDVSGGGFTQVLPELPQDNASKGTGGRVTVKEESGSPGLFVQGSTAGTDDTIEGSLDLFPVPPGGTVVFVNDGESNWMVESVFDPAAAIEASVVYQPGGTDIGSKVFTDWDALVAQIAVLRNAGAPKIKLVFDASVVSPIVIPGGGPYAMESVEWTSESTELTSLGILTTVHIPEGVTFTGLREFSGNLEVICTATATVPDESLANQEMITVGGNAQLQNTGSVPLWRGSGLAASDFVGIKTWNVGKTGQTAVPTTALIDLSVTGTSCVAVAYGGGTLIREGSFSGVVGTTLFLLPIGTGANVRPQNPSFLGTISQITSERFRFNIDTALETGPTDNMNSSDSGRLARYDTTAGNIAANIPPANNVFRGELIIIKNEVGGNAVNVTPNGADTIDGVAALYAVTAGLVSQFVSDGVSNWTRI